MRILIALVGVALVLDFLFFTGFYASDDIGYLDGARAIAGDAVYAPDLGNTRLGVTLPSAFVYWISGGSIAAIGWFHVLYHLALVILGYVLARLLHGERAGLIAAALVAINPLLYAFAGALLPDNPTSCWLVASMIAMVLVQQRAPAGDGLLDWDRKRFRGYVIAGALLGMTYTCKETGLIMTVPAAIFIMSAVSLRNLVWIQNGAALALGLVIVIALDFVALRVISGDWIVRLGMVTDSADIFLVDMRRQGATPFARVAFAKTEMTNWMPWIFWLLALGSIAYGFWKRRSIGVMAFFWWPAVYLTVGTTSLSRYIPPTIQARYYAIIIVPACVMAAAVASALIQRWLDAERPGWFHRIGPRFAVPLVLAIVCVRELRVNLQHSGIYKVTEVRAFVAALELARERYPHHPIVLSAYYQRRMKPVLYHLPIFDPARPRPAPPYIYLEMLGHLTPKLLAALDKPNRAEKLVEVQPPLNRGEMLRDAFRRMFSVAKKPQMKLRQAKDRGAAIFLISPRDPAPSPVSAPALPPAPAPSPAPDSAAPPPSAGSDAPLPHSGSATHAKP